MGLGKDSPEYRDSIFYDGVSEVEVFSDLDRAVIRLLYSGRLESGMRRDDVRRALGGD